MDVSRLRHELEDTLQQQYPYVARAEEADGEPSAWHVEFGAEMHGYVSCETHAGGTDVTSVTVAIDIGPAGHLTQQDLFGLLETNRQFFGPSLAAMHLGDGWHLYVQRRVDATGFRLPGLQELIDGMMEQTDLFLK